MVMAKLRRTGNYFLLNLKESGISSEGRIGILGMKTLFPVCCPPTIWASIALGCGALTKSCSIAQPVVWIKIAKKDHMTVDFELQFVWGRPFGVIEFKKSIG